MDVERGAVRWGTVTRSEVRCEDPNQQTVAQPIPAPVTQQPHCRMVISRTGIARITAALLQGRQLPRRVGAGTIEALAVPCFLFEETEVAWGADLQAVQSKV